MNRTLGWIIGIIIVLLGGWLVLRHYNSTVVVTAPTPTPEGEKTAANLPYLGSPATANDIVIDKPKQADQVNSPLTLSGKARGSWYFEANAPVIVIDTTGRTLGQGHITATGDWMTTNFVPFTGTITFTLATDTPEAGAVVFFNDNPSGQASTSKFMAVPVYFR